MDYYEARKAMLELCGDKYFSMAESVPARPLDYIKPDYRVSAHFGPDVIVSDYCSSWKKAIANLKIKMEATGYGPDEF